MFSGGIDLTVKDKAGTAIEPARETLECGGEGGRKAKKDGADTSIFQHSDASCGPEANTFIPFLKTLLIF